MIKSKSEEDREKVRYEDKGWEGKMQKKRRGKTEEWTLNKKRDFKEWSTSL
jgi:hypothetical protein